MELKRSHVLYDVWVEDTRLLETVDLWQTLLLSAARDAGATVLKAHFQQFTPIGITGFLLLAESHISVHTWPEEGLATIDIFTCGAMDTASIIHRIHQCLDPCKETVTTIDRGQGSKGAE